MARQSRFARTISPQNRDQFPLMDHETHAAQGIRLAFVRIVNILEFDDRRRVPLGSRRAAVGYFNRSKRFACIERVIELLSRKGLQIETEALGEANNCGADKNM